ncbi:MAG: nucleotide exchange factor GrpE [Actinobacteria bacterium]|nr:nucleotide exchange factor GrpE [Actinomycetota bacterium]
MSKKPTKKELEKELDNLNKKLEEVQSELKILREEKLRLLAEIQNLHKRYEKEIEESRKNERRKVILEIAELIDLSFTALESATKSSDENAAKGFRMIKEELEKKLCSLGIEIRDPKGEKFDYRFHHAVSTRETEDEEGTVVDVLKRCIVFDGEVLRPALVVVSKKQEQ